MLTGSLKKYLN